MPMKPYKLLLNDAFILGIILLNAVVIFISGFGIAEKPLDIVEALFTLIFVFEIGLKIRTYGRPAILPNIGINLISSWCCFRCPPWPFPLAAANSWVRIFS